VDDFQPIFKDFAKFWMERRRAGCFYAKKIINNVYGRLALNSQNTKYKLLFNSDLNVELKNPDFLELKLWGDISIVGFKLKKNKQPDKNVIAAAIIASRARIKMYKTMLLLRQEGLEILGINTDCIFLNKKSQLLQNDGVWTKHKSIFFKKPNH
jgi:hypothetical protein